MHDIRALRDNPAIYDAAWARRGLAPQSQAILEADAKLRTASTAKQEAEAARNAASKAIGQAKAQKNNTEADRLIEQVAVLKARIEETGALRIARGLAGGRRCRRPLAHGWIRRAVARDERSGVPDVLVGLRFGQPAKQPEQPKVDSSKFKAPRSDSHSTRRIWTSSCRSDGQPSRAS